MATIPLPPDFSEFLKLLQDHEVKYLLIGGYAVSYYGYVRATGDMDIWVERELIFESRSSCQNGFTTDTISGVEFHECYNEKIEEIWNGVSVNIISLDKLKKNKKASGRLKDLADLEHL